MHPAKDRRGLLAAMEDVLTSYELPYDADYPQVCLDEKLVVLHADVVESLPMQAGLPERIDYQYARVGTANLFVMVERWAGYRHVEVTEQRTALDYAHQLKWLADVRYPVGWKNLSFGIMQPYMAYYGDHR